MTIRIVRNNNGNCITFVGSSQPAYWNSCLSGEVNAEEDTRVNVINDIRSTDPDNPFYEFFGIPYTEFVDAEGNSFANATETAAYITAKANVIGGQTITFSATDTLNASRDATNTNILFSTGDAFGVHAIKAITNADGNIDIVENINEGEVIYTGVRPANITIGGDAPLTLTAAAVTNALNSLFEVTPLGLGDVDPVSSYLTLTGTPTITAFGDVIAAGDYATKGSNTGDQNNDGIYTDAVIENPGDYVCLDWNSTLGSDSLAYGANFVMGFKEGSAPVTEITSNTELMGNLDLALRLKGLHVDENHDYGSVIENGYFNAPQSQNKLRLGLDSSRRLYIELYDSTADIWQVVLRSAFVTNDETYRVVFYIKEETKRLRTAGITKHITDPSVESLTYRYIESPDGEFYYPLFATEAEANFVDSANGGTGTSHTHVFVDEIPSAGTWFMPTTGLTHAGTSAPANTDDITYTEIPTADDSSFAPTAFTIDDLTVNENTAVNYQVAPAGATWTTTVSGLPTGLTLQGYNIEGTAPEVANDNVVTPSETSTVTVTRTNSFGSASTTFNIIVINTSAPVTAITGFTHIPETIAMVDSDTLEAGSVVTIDNSLEQGKRMVFSAAFLRGLFDDIANSGSGHSVLIGVLKTGLYGSQWTNHSSQNILFGWRLHKESGNKYLSVVINGDAVSSTNFGTGTFTRDLVMFHDTASNKLFLTEWGVPGGTGETMDTPTAINRNITPGSSDVVVTIGLSIASSTNVDITTTGITEVDNPIVSNIVTNWTKALDFSGSNEYLVQGNTSANYNQPLKMGGTGVLASANADSSKTSSDTNARPWATTMVFKADVNNSNQHIWNSGEGAGSGDDNIALRLDSSGNLYFHWGRVGVGFNECRIAYALSSSNWYGVYIAHKGARLDSSNATAANLSEQFDIRLMSSADSFTNLGSNLSTFDQWTSTGTRMDRAVEGSLTIGGRAGNRNFHGKVASMVITTLKLDDTMPVDAEAKAMITDPMGWMDDYKIGASETFRRSHDNWNQTSFLVPSTSSYAYTSTQVWLMGDGVYDSYANGIRSELLNTDQSYVKLHLNSMVSNDFETVTIPGLT